METLNEKNIKEYLKNMSIQNELPDYISIDNVLAEGGQGIVFQGTVNNEKAAIKIYFPGQLVKRIDREVTALEKIESPSIVKLLWYGMIKIPGYELPVVATSFISGSNLRDLYIKRMITYDELGIITYDIAIAIEKMWEHRIVHRDIKPSNIIVHENGRACLIDLGVARHLDESTLTAFGNTWGTLGYLSPEQMRGTKQLTCKSDIYALGIVIVECGIRKHPSQGDQLKLFTLGLHNKLPEPLNSWEYSELLRTMLNPEPMRRPKPSEIFLQLKKYQWRE
jgi:serine/threonine-protein kinase